MDIRRVALTIVIVPLVGCGAASVSPRATDRSAASTESERPITLPGPEALLPAGTVEAASWIRINSLPNGFDPMGGYASTSDLAAAFGEAMRASWEAGPDRPDLSLETLEESSDRAVLIISETRFGDDSVAGRQHALILVREEDGWRLDELWTRALCSRGVSGELCV